MSPGSPLLDRAPIGTVADVHGRLALQRPRPLLVRLYAVLFSEMGVAGPPARRRARRFVLRCVPPAVALATGALVVLGTFEGAAPDWRQAAALLALAAALAGCAPPAGPAHGFQPGRPIEAVVHTGPGGGNDVLARAVAAMLQRERLLPVRMRVVNTWTTKEP